MASSRQLAGKVAIVTASTAGIGLAIARTLGRDGASVVVSSRKQKNVDEAVNVLKSEGSAVCGTVANVGKAEDRQKLVNFAVEKFGHVDVLVSNAGINPHFGSLLDVSDEIWDKIFDTNVKAAFSLSKLVVPLMEKRGGGSIIYVSSYTGYTPAPGIMAYGVSKTALFGLTKAMAITLGSTQIRVNCIAPGLIQTDFSKALWSQPREQLQKFLDDNVPLRRIGKPEDCAGIISFLCTDQAAYITGETFPVTGGMSCRL